MSAGQSIPCIVLGGTGYVAGEILRLLAGHPLLRLASVLSASRAGESIDTVFPHLAPAWPGRTLEGMDTLPRLLDRNPRLAVLAAGPHGGSAARIDSLLAEAEARGCKATVVDVSADFRFRDAGRYEAIYGIPHGAPGRLGEFRCCVPEHAPDPPPTPPPRHAAHPGCFTTSVVLAAAPLLALGLVEPDLQISSVTGSTGAGRTPSPTTHHPERHGNLFAYRPLAHRHEPEMRLLLAEAARGQGGGGGGGEPRVAFVPASGPFARGIHTTIHARLRRPLESAEIASALQAYYARSPFVSASTHPPRLKDVVGTNTCRIAAAARGRDLVVLSVLDNLTKGAAGGAIQWMNRLLGLDERAGLLLPGPGWS